MATETQTMSSPRSAPVHKFSRYRSVRQAARKPQLPAAATQASANTQSEPIQRSMSRYRKQSFNTEPSRPAERTAIPTRILHSHSASLAALTGEPCPEEQALPGAYAQRSAAAGSHARSSPKHASSMRNNTASINTPPARHASPIEETTRPRELSWEAVRATEQSPHGPAHQTFREILAAENERIPRIKPQKAVEREAKLKKRHAFDAWDKRRQGMIDTERQEGHKTEDRRQEQTRRDMKQKQGKQQVVAGEGAPFAKNGSLDLRRGYSTRHKLGSPTGTEPFVIPGNDQIQQFSEKKNLLASLRPRKTIKTSRPTSDEPASNLEQPSDNMPGLWVSKPLAVPSVGIEPPQWVDAPVARPITQHDAPVLLPQYDAPVSAVNAGERHVLVKCNASTITLPVTPATTPKDLIDSALLAMSESILPSRSKLVESFTQLGLERPLRNYEHVRDVMNSWDNDAQNFLVIRPAIYDGHDGELEAKNVSRQQPGEASVYMYHSQRPGTWNKRWITLRPDGQVTITKRAGQETSNICHLTDFDIYVPTHRQQAKRIRPPRKICFAVKSQQKSNMFLDGANFVHFFATNDQTVAGNWYKAVQGWRSWYLVNILGEGQTLARSSTTNVSIRPITARPPNRTSTDASPTKPRSFQHLLDFDHDDNNVSTPTSVPQTTISAGIVHARKMSGRDRAPPPSAFPNKLVKDAESGPLPINHNRLASMVKDPAPDLTEASTFSPTGLLGRTYSQKQRAQRDREMNARRNNSMASVESPTGLTRKPSTKSVRYMPKPLVDLSPQYQEPPQHIKKGKAVKPEPGQQLVDAATGPDLPPGAILTPSATAWRRPQAQSPPREHFTQSRRQSIDTGRPKTSVDESRPRAPTDAYRSRLNDNKAFLDGGLLARAQSKRAQGGSGIGHGVMTGDRNAKSVPMVELQSTSQFVGGSLLGQVEAYTGDDGPVIDREKRHEEFVRVGEGV